MRGFLAFCLILLSVVTLGHSFMFELEVGQEKCFRDDLSHDAVVLGEYDVSSSFNTITSIKVFDPSGQQVWNTDSAVKGTFAFTTDRAGEVKICFLDTLREGK